MLIPKVIPLRILCSSYKLSSYRTFKRPCRTFSTLKVLNNSYATDDYTNITPHISKLAERRLLQLPWHPVSLVKQKIQHYFTTMFRDDKSKPMFVSVEGISPIVSVHQNFDSLLTPLDHVSRKKSDCYYINRNYLLRGHTSAHQSELIKQGLDTFLCFGDVYRRDTIDKSHFPVFHQVEGVHLFTQDTLYNNTQGLPIFEPSHTERTQTKQELITIDATELLEHSLKSTLTGVIESIFGTGLEMRWIDMYFPFTHPSWELEIKWNGEWVEVLGCGVIEQAILNSCTPAQNRVGWAFGIGIDRLAMMLYKIPDIRMLWSESPAFKAQFIDATIDSNITFKVISKQPPCPNDLSFWIPDDFCEASFFDIVRSIGSEMVESVECIDTFTHPKSGKVSKCYRIVYQHNERALEQSEVNNIHAEITRVATKQLGIVPRT